MIILRYVKRLATAGRLMIALDIIAAAAKVIVVPQVDTIVTANEGTAADLELDPLVERSTMYA